jgi:endonuclease/exonuclease/phosphatase family metal-dependent hydrolase
MRVATFNILHGRSPVDDRVDVDRYAEAVRSLGADILALQEVDRNQPRSAGADLTAVAAQAMQAPEHRFVATLSGSPGALWTAATGEEQPDAAGYGIALVSRYPVSSWEMLRLPPVPVPLPMVFRGRRRPVLVRDEPRAAVLAVVETPHGRMTVASAHLSFISWWNRRQLRTARRSLERCAQPVLLMGDLNMGPASAERLSGMRSLASALTFPAQAPVRQLDHILAAGPLPSRVGPGRAHRLDLSDHQALSVDIG